MFLQESHTFTIMIKLTAIINMPQYLNISFSIWIWNFKILGFFNLQTQIVFCAKQCANQRYILWYNTWIWILKLDNFLRNYRDEQSKIINFLIKVKLKTSKGLIWCIIDILIAKYLDILHKGSKIFYRISSFNMFLSSWQVKSCLFEEQKL